MSAGKRVRSRSAGKGGRMIALIAAVLCAALGAGLYQWRGRPMLFATIVCAAGAVWLLLWAATGSRTLHRALIALVLLAVACFGVLEGLVIANSRSQVKDEPESMVILGAMVWANGPSPILRARLNTALAYWEEHPDVIIVVSGAQGSDEPESEAQAMYDYLTNRGVPADQILLEEQATNTMENLEYSAALLEERGYSTDNLLVVSSGFHLNRVKMLAGRLGLEISTLSAPAPDWRSRIYYYARETMALVKSWAFDR